ncbi:DoxX family protein [Chryseobacterium carnipullorum]|uniref:DoxX n=1 Tax=Chryseobacterium carnipullorum TaxID=1124835 RepID=A0A376DZ65_CHRCU|nr:DoxX family protein [Chryseobacterium carnipullorum]AZA50129.1 DoxX family protein [Chryseobacterium carnipullorum]AZA65005.1 DoxX family protein [Chryseobacterium carnipullorum]STC97292.1 DoxX [Chryseobacterium carnipullorum]
MNKNIAYFLLRMSMGVNLLGHGLARIPKLSVFADGMTKGFEKSWLPQPWVQIFSTTLPFLEFGIGLMLILGFKTRFANFAGAGLIIMLLFGSSTVENWEAMGIQMIYAVFFYILISRLEDNCYCVDPKI